MKPFDKEIVEAKFQEVGLIWHGLAAERVCGSSRSAGSPARTRVWNRRPMPSCVWISR